MTQTEWVNVDKDSAIWNVQNLIQNLIFFTWGDASWEEDSAVDFEYNASNQETLFLFKEWIDNAWVNVDQWITSYENSLIKKELYQLFENGVPVDDEQYLYNFIGDVLNNLVYQVKNGAIWENDERAMFTFNSSTSVEENRLLPQAFALGNYPNPFNPETIIQYHLPAASHVTVSIYDMQGRLIQTLIQDAFRNAGSHSLIWNGRDIYGDAVASGIYFYRFESVDITRTRRCLLMK